MPLALAVSLAAALAQTATLQLAWGARAEGRSTSASDESPAAGAPGWGSPLQQLSVVPRAAATVTTPDLRVRAEYAPRIWSSDLAGHPSPLVNHLASASVETTAAAGAPAAASLTVSGVRGRTDPLEDALRAQAAGAAAAQTATWRATPFEELQATARGRPAAGARSALDAEVAWGVSRPLEPEDRAILPSQRRLSARATGTRLLDERSALALELRGVYAVTDAAAGTATGDAGDATLTWRWRATPGAEVWAAAGGALLLTDTPPEPSRRTLRPAGSVGALVGTGDLILTGDVGTRPQIDRFTGQAVPMVEGRAAVHWSVRPTVALAATVTGASRTDGVSETSTVDLRAVWTPRERTVIEAGTLGLWQHDRRADRPSFLQAAAFVAVAYQSDLGLGAAGRDAPAPRP